MFFLTRPNHFFLYPLYLPTSIDLSPQRTKHACSTKYDQFILMIFSRSNRAEKKKKTSVIIHLFTLMMINKCLETKIIDIRDEDKTKIKHFDYMTCQYLNIFHIFF